MKNQKAAALKTVLLVTNYPAPYRMPLFNRISALLRDRINIQLRVYFAAGASEERQWRVDPETMLFEHVSGLPIAKRPSGREFARQTYRNLLTEVWNSRPLLILVDGFTLGAVKVLMLRLLIGQPYAIWGGAIGDEAAVFSSIRRMQRRLVTRFAEGAIVLSTTAAAYMKSLGMDAHRVYVALNCADAENLLGQPQANLSCELFTFVSVGTLNQRKGVWDLLAAVIILARKRQDFRLIWCGDGTERELVEAYCTAHNIRQLVEFKGHVASPELHSILRRSHCFVFPTRHDIWGLVLNEAMAAGLPSICSDRAGAAQDLVEENKTGWVVDFRRTGEVAQCMDSCLNNRSQLRDMGIRARQRVCDVASVEASATIWVDALDDFLKTR